MLGPSGSGKTTLLRMIAGFELPDDGIDRAGAAPTSPGQPPYLRNVNTVFQDYALFPHMTVRENVEYGLRVRKVPRPSGAPGPSARSSSSGSPGSATRRPVQLSGGQRQRVALARAIVNEPEVLLLDEPLGALDLKLRQEMQTELKRIQREVGITFVYVTHDQEEALTMSDRLAVMNRGRIEQLGSPTEVYERPATEFVAGFIGVSNLIERDGRRITVRPEKVRAPRGRRPDAGRRPRRGRRDRRGRPTSACSRGTSSTLDSGDKLVAVRQNLETAGADALELDRSTSPRRVATRSGVRDHANPSPVRGGTMKQPTHRGPRARSHVACVAALALMLAACGSSSKSSTATGQRAPTRELGHRRPERPDRQHGRRSRASGRAKASSTSSRGRATRSRSGSSRSSSRPAARSTPSTRAPRARWCR